MGPKDDSNDLPPVPLSKEECISCDRNHWAVDMKAQDGKMYCLWCWHTWLAAEIGEVHGPVEGCQVPPGQRKFDKYGHIQVKLSSHQVPSITESSMKRDDSVVQNVGC